MAVCFVKTMRISQKKYLKYAGIKSRILLVAIGCLCAMCGDIVLFQAIGHLGALVERRTGTKRPCNITKKFIVVLSPVFHAISATINAGQNPNLDYI